MYRGTGTRPELPTEPNSFVGRERELDELRKLVFATRMVTLTGPGGIGKTRLALHALALIADEFPDGACYVELADVTSPDLVVARVASAVGVTEEQGRPLLDTLADALRPRSWCSRSTTASTCSMRAPGSAGGCSPARRTLRLLATSREPLRVAGETVWQVPPLAVASADGSAPEAVQLFARTGGGDRPRLRADPGQRGRGGGDLPVARRHPAGDRTGRRPGPRAVRGADPDAGRRPVRAADRRRPGGGAGGSGRCAPPSTGATTC